MPDSPPQEPERGPRLQTEPTHAKAAPERPAAANGEPSRKAASAIAWLPPDFPWPLAAAGAAGVVLTLLVLALAGAFRSRDSGPSPIEARFMRIEQQVRELAAKPAPVTADPRVVDELAGRLSRLEATVATPRPPVADPAVANRIALLEGEIKALGERIGVIARRSDEVALTALDARKRADAAITAGAPSVPRAEIDALAKRIAALEQTAKSLEAELGRRAGVNGNDAALRLLAVAGALNAAVDHGAPFVAELDAARALAPDPRALAPLAAFAVSGVPSGEELARELAALLPTLAKAVGTRPSDGGFLDRLKASAEKLIRIRPIDEPPGDDPDALIRRIQAKASQRNIAGAAAEVNKLPAPARALANEWAAKVQAREAALEASRRFVAAALAAAGKPSL